MKFKYIVPPHTNEIQCVQLTKVTNCHLRILGWGWIHFDWVALDQFGVYDGIVESNHLNIEWHHRATEKLIKSRTSLNLIHNSTTRCKARRTSRHAWVPHHETLHATQSSMERVGVSWCLCKSHPKLMLPYTPFTTTKRMFYDCNLWLHSVIKSQNMTDEAPEEDDERSDWVYSISMSCFGHRSYECVR